LLQHLRCARRSILDPFGNLGGDFGNILLLGNQGVRLLSGKPLFLGGGCRLAGDFTLGGGGPFQRLGGAGQLANFDRLLPPPGVGQLGFDLGPRLVDRRLSFFGGLLP
jgi:hypothetical protein